MIAYNCRYGYVNNADYRKLTNINQVTFFEEGLWSICTGAPLNEDIDISINVADAASIYGIAESYLGQDVNAIYLPRSSVYSISGKQKNRLSSAFPSVKLNAPIMFDSDNKAGFVIYIPKLSVISLNNASSIIGKVLSDGSIDYYTYPSRYFGYYAGASSSYFIFLPAIKDYKGPSSLKDPNNYGQFYITSGETSSRFELIDKPPSYSNVIEFIYGDSEIPSPDIDLSPTNPYDPIGPSGPTDPNLPTGTFDDTSDPIPDSSLPTISAANTGFTRIYNPTLSQVQQLARYLWTDESVIQTIWNHIKQYFEDPMQAIIGFNLVPVPVPDGGTQNFALMYIDTGVQMTVAANQFVDVDCGTLQIDYYYGSALDHSPYTKIHCFLPFIGTVRVNTDEVMGKTLQVKYRVDIVTGSCVAKIFVDGSCLYQYSGHCAINIPISSSDFSSYVSAAINVAKSAAMGAVAGMAAGAPVLAEETGLALNIPNSLGPSTSLAVQDKIPVGPQSPVYPNNPTPANMSGMSPKNISNTVSQISGGKPYIEHSGAFSGNSGYLGIRRPFLIIERPNMCLPENYQSLNGFPAMITMELGTCKGYTRIQQVQLTGLSATTNEQAEILNLLKGGVVF